MSIDRYAQAKQLFLRALELEADQRQAFVERACGQDQQLREEVRSLLKHHDTRTLLGNPQAETAIFPDARRQPSSPSPRKLLPVADRTMTWVSRNLSPAGHLALGILVATLLVLLVGYVASATAMHSIRELRIGILGKVVDTSEKALKLWSEHEKDRVRIVAKDSELRALVQQLAQAAQDNSTAADLRDSPLQQELRAEMVKSFQPNVRYAVWDGEFRTIADWSPRGVGIGEGVTPYGKDILKRVFAGETVIQMPGLREPITKGYPIDHGAPTIGILTPITDARGKTIAAMLVYGLGAETRFQVELSLLDAIEAGQMYAFDEQGLMISNSRFDGQHREIGLLPQNPNAHSSLTIHARDPGGDLTRGYKPPSNPETWPLTLMAAHATQGEDGFNVTGYNDYRGVRVIGVWRWLEDQKFGVAAEVSYDKAFHDFRVVQSVMAALYTLFVAAVGCVVWSFLAVRRARRQLGEARRLGPYTLERLIGEGGMGQVYLARHALLKRPTAVKLLRPEVASPLTLEWFEREVQLASQLTHANTIEIFDYGKSDENVFYYAMEYLTGLTLDDLVYRCGPLPPARAVYLLRQIGLSLREAHELGLIHRDIKPQNIMVCRRGGESDVVKVLDFGLARDAAADPVGLSSAAIGLAGTPLYMAPERFLDPLNIDARVDIYAWGVVAFKLLTGQDLFDTSNTAQLLNETLERPAERPSQRLGKPLDESLDRLITDCLAKRPEERPDSMATVLACLDDVTRDERTLGGRWGPAEADAWWDIQSDLKVVSRQQ